MIDDIKSLLVDNSALSALYINCSKINKIEKTFGKKIYCDVLTRIKSIILDMKGKEIRHDDIVASNTPEGDEFIIFLAKKREDRGFYPADLESLCDRITSYLNTSVFPIIFPYIKGRPNITIGHAIVLYNPLIKEERLINKLIEDAKLISDYREFKRLMRNKEKIQELIMKEDIRTVFQPAVSFKDNEIIGYEALSRGPEGTEYEDPYLLLDAAAEAELLFEFDRVCRKKALFNARSLNSRYKLFINCFPSVVHDPEFKDKYLESFLEELKISPANIVLEMTEREAIENYELFKEALLYYSGLGFAVAVDDAGTGYSGLEILFELKPDFIKIDISIVKDIDKYVVKQELAKALLSISKDMNSTLIAEGIETEEELNTLKKIGVKFGQGFLFARPGPAFPDIKS